jgi:GAF domain-containing protein
MRQNNATVFLSPEQEITADDTVATWATTAVRSESAAEPSPSAHYAKVRPRWGFGGAQKSASIENATASWSTAEVLVEPVSPQLPSDDEMHRTQDATESLSVNPAAVARSVDIRANERKPVRPFNKQSAFEQMAGLIANMTESYSVLIFEADNKLKTLRPFASHTLSRDILTDIEIGYGSGLVGWTAENRVRISVCPFERDATTLLYYGCDQALKSFIAIPVLSARDGETLLGVIACDSKKSYAYSKMAEKLLVDCAEQTAVLFELFTSVGCSDVTKQTERRQEFLATFLEQLRQSQDEAVLLQSLQQLPATLVETDAVIVVSASHSDLGDATFYPKAARNDVEHRLMQIVCKHKRLKTHGKSVHALPLDDKQKRSFLSIPIRYLDREVGSLNLLSQPQAAFTSEAIAMLESLAKDVGVMLERIRLREAALSQNSSVTLLPWATFKEKAEAHLNAATREKRRLELLRISFVGLVEDLEHEAGIEVGLAVMQRLGRLIDQVGTPLALTGSIQLHEFVLLVDVKESAPIVGRFQRLLQRLNFSDITREPLATKTKLADLLTKSMRVSAAEFPKEGSTVAHLLANCHIALYRQAYSAIGGNSSQAETTVQHAKSEKR